jgi:hypothetical protein
VNKQQHMRHQGISGTITCVQIQPLFAVEQKADQFEHVQYAFE